MDAFPYQQQAMQLYAALAVAVFLLAWWIVRRWLPVLRLPLLALVGALAFTPAFVIPDKDFLAPAVVHLIFDAGQHLHDGQLLAVVLKDLTPIALVFGLALVLGGIWHWLSPSRADRDRDVERNGFQRRLAEARRDNGRRERVEPDSVPAPREEARADTREQRRIEPEIRLHRPNSNGAKSAPGGKAPTPKAPIATRRHDPDRR